MAKTVFTFTLGVAAILLVFSANVFASCWEPSRFGSPPSFIASKPSPPYCLYGYAYSREHTCESYEIDSYIDQVNSYIAELNNFAEEARTFALKAINFSDEVNEFANCAAQEAKSEIE